MLGAFLIELAGAVVTLFRNAPFFEAKVDLVSSLSRSVEVIDALTPQIEAVSLGQTQADVDRHYGIVIRKDGKDLVAYQRIHVIESEDLKKLPQEQQEVLEAYESSMNQFGDRWKALYSKRGQASDEERGTIDNDLKTLVKEMRKDLTGVLDSLARQGGTLNDHYRHIRGIVDKIATES